MNYEQALERFPEELRDYVQARVSENLPLVGSGETLTFVSKLDDEADLEVTISSMDDYAKVAVVRATHSARFTLPL